MAENNDWINDAFKAAVDSEKDSTAVKIAGFLNDCTPALLDTWTRIVGTNTAIKFGKLVLENDWFADAIDTLQDVFFTAGYLLSKDADSKQ